jgi:uncharacterized protein involved in response to NO
MNSIWKLLGLAETPKPCSESRKAAARAFQRMWVAGTLGALFTAFARFLPKHLMEMSWQFNPDYTLDRLLRYGYLLWLTAYFFISNLKNEEQDPTKPDIVYDILQSICALIAAFYLGFALDGIALETTGAMLAANGAIFVICVAAWQMFRDLSTKAVNFLRLAGAVISFGTILIAFSSLSDRAALIAYLVLEIPLFLLLVLYILIRLNSAQQKRAPEKAVA